MSKSQLPLTIGIGTRIRKSPYYESNLKYGVTGFTVYNKMYLPTAFSGPEKEYESLINDVTFGDFAAAFREGPLKLRGNTLQYFCSPSPSCPLGGP